MPLILRIESGSVTSLLAVSEARISFTLFFSFSPSQSRSPGVSINPCMYVHKLFNATSLIIVLLFLDTKVLRKNEINKNNYFFAEGYKYYANETHHFSYATMCRS